MKAIYNASTVVAKCLLPVLGLTNHKIKLGAIGRERTWDILDQHVKHSIPKIWVHAASLGEYEQIVPVLEHINREEYQVILTFFSPSGYENKKHTKLADTVCYLPLDTKSNVDKFLQLVEPSLAIMVKYEFWPNYLEQLKQRDIHTILVSGIFRENSVFTTWYGSWMKRSLKAIDHFFLQNDSSKMQLEQLGFTNATVSGDTRFDRASSLIEQDYHVTQLDEFTKNSKCLVVGSSWPEDIAIMKNWLQHNESNKAYKIIIAPHEVGDSSISSLVNQLEYQPLLWSELHKENNLPNNSQTLVINNIGLLTKAYAYADLAYVGGAMGTKGLHNILEAATYAVPVIIGKNYEKFPEAGKLEDLGGLFSVATSSEFESITNQLLEDDYLRDKTGMICGHWINSNTGATRMVLNHLKQINENMVIS